MDREGVPVVPVLVADERNVACGHRHAGHAKWDLQSGFDAFSGHFGLRNDLFSVRAMKGQTERCVSQIEAAIKTARQHS